MTAKNKIRGNNFERDLVNLAKAEGLSAIRAWGSDGRSLGLSADVDMVVNGFKIQAKRRKKLASYLEIPDSCDIVAFKQDRKPPLIMMTYTMFISICTEWKEAEEWLKVFSEGGNEC